MSKSYGLDKRLKELLAPMGFIKIPSDRALIRLCGEGIFQGVAWDWCPSVTHQYLIIWASSIWQRPDHLFEPHLLHRFAALSGGEDSSEYCWDGNSFSYHKRQTPIETEDDEINHFVRYILPFADQCITQKILYDTLIKAQTTRSGRIWYTSLRHFNYALYFSEYDEAKKYLHGTIDQKNIAVRQESKYISTLEAKKRLGNIQKQTYERFKQNVIDSKKEIKKLHELEGMISSPETVKQYLEECKRKNLEDFSKLMKGKTDDIIVRYL